MFCIYKITNKINGHSYVGQHKYNDETNPMSKYKGSGLLLHKAYKKYGIENFETEVLYSRIRDKSTVDSMEIWAIAKYKPEYNISKGGTGGDTMTPHSEYKFTEESYYRMTHATLGKHWKLSEETKQKMSEFQKTRKHTKEQVDKMKETKKGLKPYHNPETGEIKWSKEPIEGWVYGTGLKQKPCLGKHPYNNGVISVFRTECPEGFVPGLIRRKRG